MKREDAISVLSRLRPELEARGVVHAGIFGSVARGQAGPRSDVDVVVAFKQGMKPDLIDLGGVQSVLEEGFGGRDVDVVIEPVRNPKLRQAVAQDRASAF